MARVTVRGEGKARGHPKVPQGHKMVLTPRPGPPQPFRRIGEGGGGRRSQSGGWPGPAHSLPQPLLPPSTGTMRPRPRWLTPGPRRARAPPSPPSASSPPNSTPRPPRPPSFAKAEVAPGICNMPSNQSNTSWTAVAWGLQPPSSPSAPLFLIPEAGGGPSRELVRRHFGIGRSAKATLWRAQRPPAAATAADAPDLAALPPGLAPPAHGPSPPSQRSPDDGTREGGGGYYLPTPPPSGMLYSSGRCQRHRRPPSPSAMSSPSLPVAEETEPRVSTRTDIRPLPVAHCLRPLLVAFDKK